MARRRASGQRLLLAEDTDRTTGRDARSMNVTAARAIAEAVRTTLGPKGMDKMLLDGDGNVVITNDGVTILSEMDIDHPGANMIVEVAETQEGEVGDGTTTAVVLAGELLKQASDLVDQDIHPTTVANGFRRATAQAGVLLDDLALDVDPDDRDTLEQIAITVMTGKSAEDAREHLAELLVDAALTVRTDGWVNLENIDVNTVVGQPIDASELIEGVVIEEEPVHPQMPGTLSDAAVGVLASGIEVEEPEIDAEIAIDDPERLLEFQTAERDSLRERAEAIADAGVDFLVAGDDIADVAAEALANAGVVALEDVDDDELSRIARATGARVATTVAEFDEDILGYAGSISVDSLGEDDVVIVGDVDAGEVVTLVLRAGTEGALDEVERAIMDSLHAVRVAVGSGEVVAGGAASETALALALRDYADSVGGREQLAVEAYADALEVVPRTLAENAGLDPIDALVELRAEHSGGADTAGLDAVTGDVIDMWEEGVVEPAAVKRQAIGSATEAAVMILRIDDVISASS